MKRSTQRGLELVAALVVATLICQASACAQQIPASVGAYIHTKLFGDYGPVSLITGKPRPSYVDGERVLPEDGLFSSQMRKAVKKLHHRPETDEQTLYPAMDFGELTAQNLILRVPSGQWKQKAPRQGRPIVLHRKDQLIVAELAANRLGVEAGSTNQTILAFSQSALNNAQNASIAPELYHLSAEGLPGLMYRATIRQTDGSQNHSAVWVAAKNGYTYELVVYGDVSNQQVIDETLISFVRNAREKKPDHIAYGRKGPSKWKFWEWY